MPKNKIAAPQGAGAAGAGPATEQAPHSQEQKPVDLVYGSITRVDALRLDGVWLVEYRICSSRRECRDTIYAAWPKDCLLARDRKVLLRIRGACVQTYAQYSNTGRLKWAVLRVFFEKDGALWKAEWRYDEYDDISKIYYMAREAWNLIEHVGVAAKEALILWLRQRGLEEIIKALI
jgi:hypothetical protein